MVKLQKINELEVIRKQLQEERKKIKSTIVICGGTGCQASQSVSVIAAIRDELAKNGLDKQVQVRVTGCHGFCEQGPIMIFEPSNLFYCHVTPADVPDIVGKTVKNGEVLEHLLYTDALTGKRIKKESKIPFYQAQDRQILAYSRLVDPNSLNDYVAIGGYMALVKTLREVKPRDVIREVAAAGLRGRGGAGFPTGEKWDECAQAPGDEKFVVCNADEGDPGAYMDRCVLEANPHLIIEGMLIGAWAINATQGYIYVRKEYPLAVKHIRAA